MNKIDKNHKEIFFDQLVDITSTESEELSFIEANQELIRKLSPDAKRKY